MFFTLGGDDSRPRNRTRSYARMRLLTASKSRCASLEKSRIPTPQSSDDDTALQPPSPAQSALLFEKFVHALDDRDPFITALLDVLVKVRWSVPFRGWPLT